MKGYLVCIKGSEETDGEFHFFESKVEANHYMKSCAESFELDENYKDTEKTENGYEINFENEELLIDPSFIEIKFVPYKMHKAKK